MVKYAICWDEENAYWVTSVPGPSGTTQNYSPDVDDAALFCEKSAALALMKTIGLETEEHSVREIHIGRS